MVLILCLYIGIYIRISKYMNIGFGPKFEFKTLLCVFEFHVGFIYSWVRVISVFSFWIVKRYFKKKFYFRNNYRSKKYELLIFLI